MIKGVEKLSVQPEYYIVTIGKKKYKAYTLRGCFKASNGRWPTRKELIQFIDLITLGRRE